MSQLRIVRIRFGLLPRRARGNPVVRRKNVEALATGRLFRVVFDNIDYLVTPELPRG